MDNTIFEKEIHTLPVDDNGIPIFLPIIIDEIISKSSFTGIFRICGNYAIVQQMGKLALNNIAFIPPDNAGVYDFASFLKQWLMSLPEPILCPSVVNEFFKNGNKESVYETLLYMDPLNRKCVALIFRVIDSILSNSETNLMTFENLSVCFFGSFLQQMNNDLYKSDFDLHFFYETSMKIINEKGTDFNLVLP